MIKPLSLLSGSFRSSINAWNRSNPCTSVRLRTYKKLRHRKPTVPTVALDMARVRMGGSYGLSSAAIVDSFCYNTPIQCCDGNTVSKQPSRRLVMRVKRHALALEPSPSARLDDVGCNWLYSHHFLYFTFSSTCVQALRQLTSLDPHCEPAQLRARQDGT